MRKSATTWSVLRGAGVTVVALAALHTQAAEADSFGFGLEASPASPWQTRLALGDGALRLPGPARSGLAPSSASLVGDYYFGRSLTGLPSPGGFRATSGLIFGPRAPTASSGFAGSTSFSVGSPSLGGAPMSALRDANVDLTTVPYLGVGYTGLRPHSGWRYNADLGLIAQSPGGLRSVRGQSLDDTVRDMRLAPVLQLGVSYSY